MLQREKGEVEAQNSELARELELYMGKDKEYAKLGVRRGEGQQGLGGKGVCVCVSM